MRFRPSNKSHAPISSAGQASSLPRLLTDGSWLDTIPFRPYGIKPLCKLIADAIVLSQTGAFQFLPEIDRYLSNVLFRRTLAWANASNLSPNFAIFASLLLHSLGSE